ncbi:hypothetical protein BH23ACT5_BH23ACT5_01050 [soil metagenome]
MAIHDLLARDRYAERLGVEVIAVEGHQVVLGLVVGDHHLDRFGRVSAGVLFSFADCAMSLVSNAEATAVAVTTHFVRPPGAPLAPPTLRAEVRPLSDVDAQAVTWQVLVRVGSEVGAIFTGTTLRRV